MIVSHHRRFVFVATPKVASQSIRRHLRQFTEPDDWEQCGLYERRYIPIPHLAIKQTGHLTLNEVRPFLTEEQWQTYFKFAFVREPMDRFLSACFFLIAGLEQQTDPNRVILEHLDRPEWVNQIHLRPQTEFIYQNNELVADFLGRYENITEDLKTINQSIGVEHEAQLPTLNVTASRDWRFKPDAEVVRRVSDLYRNDYQRLGYVPVGC